MSGVGHGGGRDALPREGQTDVAHRPRCHVKCTTSPFKEDTELDTLLSLHAITTMTPSAGLAVNASPCMASARLTRALLGVSNRI
jgi:hypothetical protein